MLNEEIGRKYNPNKKYEFKEPKKYNEEFSREEIDEYDRKGRELKNQKEMHDKEFMGYDQSRLKKTETNEKEKSPRDLLSEEFMNFDQSKLSKTKTNEKKKSQKELIGEEFMNFDRSKLRKTETREKKIHEIVRVLSKDEPEYWVNLFEKKYHEFENVTKKH